MISVTRQVILNEGVWSFIKNSLANIFKRTVKVKEPEMTSEEKITRTEAIHKRLTPRPTPASSKKIGFKDIT